MSTMLAHQNLTNIGMGSVPLAARSWSTGADCCSGPRFLEVERGQVFDKTRQFLGHEERLHDPASYAATDIEGQSVLAARDAEGALRALYNVCKHRSHELLKGDGKTRAATCPYHTAAYTLERTFRRTRHRDYIDTVLRPEDIAVTKNVQRGMRTRAFKQGRHLIDPVGSGLSEQAVQHFHGLLLRAYGRAPEQ